MARSSTPAGLACGPLEDPGSAARGLFAYAGAWAPPPPDIAAGWAARDGGRLVGALLLQRAGSAAMLHGPVVVLASAGEDDEALEVGATLVELALEAAASLGVDSVFARPQGLDRAWVRLGFIPVPEAELPGGLRGVEGVGLFGWRGGSALWSAAGRGAGARVSRRARR